MHKYEWKKLYSVLYRVLYNINKERISNNIKNQLDATIIIYY